MRLAAEEFGASRAGQQFAGALENQMHRMGGLNYAVPEGVGLNRTAGGVPINGATRNVPLGFESESQFLTASKELNDVMSAHGINDAIVGVRGSSVTGFGGNPKSPTFGQPFGPTSDIDLFVESAVAVNAFKKQPGFVHPDKMINAFPGLDVWSQRWSDILGRPVSPAAWKPGARPPTPAILVK